MTMVEKVEKMSHEIFSMLSGEIPGSSIKCVYDDDSAWLGKVTMSYVTTSKAFSFTKTVTSVELVDRVVYVNIPKVINSVNNEGLVIKGTKMLYSKLAQVIAHELGHMYHVINDQEGYCLLMTKDLNIYGIANLFGRCPIEDYADQYAFDVLKKYCFEKHVLAYAAFNVCQDDETWKKYKFLNSPLTSPTTLMLLGGVVVTVAMANKKKK